MMAISVRLSRTAILGPAVKAQTLCLSTRSTKKVNGFVRCSSIWSRRHSEGTDGYASLKVSVTASPLESVFGSQSSVLRPIPRGLSFRHFIAGAADGPVTAEETSEEAVLAAELKDVEDDLIAESAGLSSTPSALREEFQPAPSPVREEFQHGSPALSSRASRNITVPIQELQRGAVFKGTVIGIQAFGAFVNFGAFADGLVHVSKMSAGYVNDPRDIVTLGQEVTVTLLNYDQTTGRIALSLVGKDEFGSRGPGAGGERSRFQLGSEINPLTGGRPIGGGAPMRPSRFQSGSDINPVTGGRPIGSGLPRGSMYRDEAQPSEEYVGSRYQPSQARTPAPSVTGDESQPKEGTFGSRFQSNRKPGTSVFANEGTPTEDSVGSRFQPSPVSKPGSSVFGDDAQPSEGTVGSRFQSNRKPGTSLFADEAQPREGTIGSRMQANLKSGSSLSKNEAVPNPRPLGPRYRVNRQPGESVFADDDDPAEDFFSSRRSGEPPIVQNTRPRQNFNKTRFQQQQERNAAMGGTGLGNGAPDWQRDFGRSTLGDLGPTGQQEFTRPKPNYEATSSPGGPIGQQDITRPRPNYNATSYPGGPIGQQEFTRPKPNYTATSSPILDDGPLSQQEFPRPRQNLDDKKPFVGGRAGGSPASSILDDDMFGDQIGQDKKTSKDGKPLGLDFPEGDLSTFKLGDLSPIRRKTGEGDNSNSSVGGSISDGPRLPQGQVRNPFYTGPSSQGQARTPSVGARSTSNLEGDDDWNRFQQDLEESSTPKVESTKPRTKLVQIPNAAEAKDIDEQQKLMNELINDSPSS